MVARKYVSLSIHSEAFPHEVVCRKVWGTCRSPKSYNFHFECPLSQNSEDASCLSQKFMWASVTSKQEKLLWQRFCHSGKRGPGNETKRNLWLVLDPLQNETILKIGKNVRYAKTTAFAKCLGQKRLYIHIRVGCCKKKNNNKQKQRPEKTGNMKW